MSMTTKAAPSDMSSLPPVEYYNIIDENMVPVEESLSRIIQPTTTTTTMTTSTTAENLKLIQQILDDLKGFLENHRKHQQQQQQRQTTPQLHHFQSGEELSSSKAASKIYSLDSINRDFERRYSQEFNRKFEYSPTQITENDYGISLKINSK